MQYCESTFKTKRWKTREVMVGNIGVGGSNPIRIQSMTTSNTRDVAATVAQIMRLADAGCEIARVTVQGIKEAEACEHIKNELMRAGYTIPLVADIHFYPPAALKVVDFADKVRINPGNFVDKRASFKTIEYTDASYAEELEKIEEKFTPLVEKCKGLKRAMRIGTNHGSLSDRIMNRYGDTPQGMVESALEFARICRKMDYHDFLFSMKSSNPQVMVLAYRLLVAEMIRLGWDYPVHLGVTEAGEGEDGRVKSSMGIGALLLDGIGDTIRVSLTEDPWFEIDPCKRLRHFAESYHGTGVMPFAETHRDFRAIARRLVHMPSNLGLHRDGSVFVSPSKEEIKASDFYQKIGCDVQLSRPKLTLSSADSVFLETLPEHAAFSKHLTEAGIGVLSSVASLANATRDTPVIRVSDEPTHEWARLIELKPSLILLNPTHNRLHASRHFFEWLQDKSIHVPVLLNFSYACSKEDLIMHASAECGTLLCDGLGEGIFLEGAYDVSFLRVLSFTILQAARMRIFKTDFISCPSCGRTLFDLQEVTRRIRARTEHLAGIKIAIMGCIVNGPGEMADADFGYVGSKPHRIDLYVGKQCVEKDIPFEDADDRLVALIQAHGKWKDPKTQVNN